MDVERAETELDIKIIQNVFISLKKWHMLYNQDKK